MQNRKFPKSRKLILLLGDMALIAIAYIIATSIILDRDIIVNNIYLYSGMLPVTMVISSLLLNINGLYSIGRKRFAEIILSTFIVNLCTLILVMALSFFFMFRRFYFYFIFSSIGVHILNRIVSGILGDLLAIYYGRKEYAKYDDSSL